jgi:hypothetical protein
VAAAPGRDRFDDICDALTAWHEDVRRSTIFGMPCLKKSGRVFAGFVRGAGGTSRFPQTPSTGPLSRTGGSAAGFPRSGLGMVFKLTDADAHARALALPGAHLFHPGGGDTVFKQWVVVPPDQADEWEGLAMDALRGAHAPRWENQDPAASSR